MNLDRAKPGSRSARALSFALALVVARAADAATHGPAVVYVTQDTAYLNRGLADGLEAGATLRLMRHEHAVGACHLDHISEHHASCVVPGAEIGDSFAAPSVTRPSKPGFLRTVSIPIPAGATHRIAAAPFPLVEFRGRSSVALGGARMPGSVSLSHTTWGTGASNTTYNLESIDVLIAGVPLPLGAQFSAAAQVLFWSLRPTNARYRPDAATVLLVHEVAVSLRQPGDAFVVSAGRIHPWHTPGLWLLDGVQAGWRTQSGSFEAGVFGGSLPDEFTLTPMPASWIGGVYFYNSLFHDRSFTLWDEGRVDVSDVVGDQMRGEAEVRLDSRFGSVFGFSGDVRGGLPLQTNVQPLLEMAALNATLRPTDQLRFDAAFQYLSPLDPTASISPFLYAGTVGFGSRHADLTANLDVTRSLEIGALAGYSDDIGEGTGPRIYLGPLLALPRFMGSNIDLAAGYQQCIGYFPGAIVYLQALASPLAYLRLLGRVTYLDTSYGPGSGLAPEIGAYLHAELEIGRHFSVGISGMVRTGSEVFGYQAGGTLTGRL